ncbi:amino acid adenylation domain-containing protein [Plantactinospora sp. ZYX-F-223]|uniref:amino acid adenylation domain-containing protein n=1 Tax=Plantactinospora sp. ZYX-F-223 TaxID=3144103 RepID=UPI0031FDB168
MLSFAQERMWFFEQLAPDTAVYNLPAVLRLAGDLDHEVLERCFAAVVARHTVMRTTYDVVDGQPTPSVGSGGGRTLTLHDLTSLPAERREGEAATLMQREIERPFDLRQGPLVRLTLIRVEDRDHLLVLNMHHIVGDAWSWDTLLSEVTEAYRTMSAGLPYSPPPPVLQYSDVAAWQRKRYAEGDLEEQLRYWRSALDGAGAATELPIGRTRPAAPRFRGSVVNFDVPARLVARLRRLGGGEEATLFMIALTVFGVLLHRYTGHQDIVIGTPVAGRRSTQLESIVGLFVNTLLLRTRIHAALSFRDILRDVRRVAIDAYDHQDVPFEKLVEELQPARSAGMAPFFQIMFAYRTAVAERQWESLRMRQVKVHNGTAKRDLTMQLVESGDHLEGHVEFDTDLFTEGAIRRFVGHYLRLLAEVVDEPDRPVAHLALLTADEERQLRSWSVGPSPEAAEPGGVHQLFEAQARRNPEAVAVAGRSGRLTYAQVDRRARELAGRLTDMGVGPEVAVGLRLDRLPETVVALLAVLMAGGVYVPVDPTDPDERVQAIFRDARVRVVITTPEGHHDAGTYQLVRVHPEAPDVCRPATAATVAIEPAQAAYILYTSGSTGTPKGVVVEHSQLTSYVRAIVERLALDEPMSYAMVQPLTVDSCLTMLYPPLITGGSVHVIGRETAIDAAALADYVQVNRIDCLKIAPSHLRALQQSPRFADLLPARRLIIGGEASDWSWVRRLQTLSGDCRLYNHYGPTEATVGVTTFPVFEHLASDYSVTPLGNPLPGSEAYVLDPQLHLVPVGVPGELHLAGTNIARGYHGRAGLTARQFVPNPFGPAGDRLYRTGDIVRRLEGGEIEYLGRRDEQVKIRGFRVELGDVATRLATHPDVADAVVAAREDERGTRSLVAYLVPVDPATLDVAAVRVAMQQALPHHMVPSAYVVLSALPLSAHGKVDRQALPAPGVNRPARGPRRDLATDAEHIVSGIWLRLLGAEGIGVTENFFEAGGHSLLLVRVHQELQEAFGRQFPLAELFNFTTIETQAAFLADATAGSDASRRGQERGRRQAEVMRQRQRALRAGRDEDG